MNAKARDAVAITFKVSSEAAFDLMQIRVNGETVKCFGGEHDWMTYAYAFDADGEYTVSIAYTKDEQGESGEDLLWIDSVAPALRRRCRRRPGGQPRLPGGRHHRADRFQPRCQGDRL